MPALAEAAPPRVALAVCTHAPGAPEGAEVVADLCRRPGEIPELVSRTGAERLVLGLCRAAAPAHEFQAWARKAGLDPFAVELVELAGDTEDGAIARMRAAAARVRAFTGSRPQQLALRLLGFEQARSRRSLFTLPPTTYEAVAFVDAGRCLGTRACGLCLRSCAPSALRPSRGRVEVDRSLCDGCGACVSDCPAGAVALPAASTAEFEAALASLLDGSRPALAFACRHAAVEPAVSAGWLPVAVPSLAIVTAGWMLQSLAHGARAVALLPCESACCASRSGATSNRVAYVHAVLGALGERDAEASVSVLPPDGATAPPVTGETRAVARPSSLELREPKATVEALHALARAYGVDIAPAILHPASPLGVVRVDDARCTACGACVAACPTGALESTAGEVIELSHDPSLCIACSRCVEVCPERPEAIRLVGVTDLGLVASGRVAVKRSAVARCRRCGGAVAPEAVLRRVQASLEREDGGRALLSVVAEVCADCRSAGW